MDTIAQIVVALLGIVVFAGYSRKLITVAKEAFDVVVSIKAAARDGSISAEELTDIKKELHELKEAVKDVPKK